MSFPLLSDPCVPSLSDPSGESGSAGPLFSPGDHYIFVSLGSGSSGNSYFLEHQGCRLLIDAGLGSRMIRSGLRHIGIPPETLAGILVTHDHADHIRGVGGLATHYGIPVYASIAVSEALLTSRHVSEDLGSLLCPMVVGDTWRLGRMRITSFEVPHDSTQNVGYIIESSAGVLVLITDIGHITPDITEAVGRANYLIFESNYDPEMLVRGSYPEFLKSRIMGGQGHLSNLQASEFMAKNYHLDLSFLALCHLSKENNHPDLAWKTMECRLSAEGVRVGKDLQLMTLKRTTPSSKIILRPSDLL